MMNPMINNIDFNFVELTAGNSKRALLSVERVELQVHRARQRQRDPSHNIHNRTIYFNFNSFLNRNKFFLAQGPVFLLVARCFFKETFPF